MPPKKRVHFNISAAEELGFFVRLVPFSCLCQLTLVPMWTGEYEQPVLPYLIFPRDFPSLESLQDGFILLEFYHILQNTVGEK